MNLLENGQLQISVTELPYEKAINIPHQILPDETPKTVRTEISGNTARFYDINGNLLGSESMPFPNYTEMVNELKKMGKNLNPVDVNNFISTFQGQPFLANLEEFIRNAPANGAQILTNNDNYVSFRTDYQKIDPRMHYSSVTLINKTMNKVVGIHYHDKEEKLIQAIYYVYNKGKEQFLDAIITEEMETLPSGKKVKVITTSKIENLNFDVNLD